MRLPRLPVVTVALAVLACAAGRAQTEAEFEARARALHTHIIALDTHLDTPANFLRAGWDMGERHAYSDDFSQVDFPRMKEGGLTGGFFAVYTPQGPRTPEGLAAARDYALQTALAIRVMVASHPNQCALALTPADAPRIAASGKAIIYMSIENGYPLGKDLTLVKTFYDFGVRVIGPVHFENNDLGDSASDAKGPEWHGLSPEGKDLVAECNRLGILLDASHASDDVFHQMIALSKTPIILTHSGSRAVYNHPRNATDAMMKELADHGGVIQMNTYSSYLAALPPAPERNKALHELFSKLGGRMEMTPEQRGELMKQYAAINQKYPPVMTTFAVFMQHLLHAIEVAGVDHVGIGADFDGGGGVVGLEDATGYWKITAALMQHGYSDADIEKIWSGNSLRVLKLAQDGASKAVAAK